MTATTEPVRVLMGPKILPCPFCKAELYDGIVLVKDDPTDKPRCWNCLADVLDDGRPWTLEERRWSGIR